MIKTLPLADVKKNFSSIVKEVDEQYDRVIVTRNGVGKAVILSSEEYDGLLETLDILSNPEEKEALAQARKEVEKKETISLDSFLSHVKDADV